MYCKMLTTYFEVLSHTFPILCFILSCALRPSLLCYVAVWATEGSFLLIPAPRLFSKPDGLIMRVGPVHLSTDRLDFPMFSFLLSQPFPQPFHHVYVYNFMNVITPFERKDVFQMELCHDLVVFFQSREETKSWIWLKLKPTGH